jgi:hypothetical protein
VVTALLLASLGLACAIDGVGALVSRAWLRRAAYAHAMAHAVASSVAVLALDVPDTVAYASWVPAAVVAMRAALRAEQRSMMHRRMNEIVLRGMISGQRPPAEQRGAELRRVNRRREAARSGGGDAE